MVVVEVPGGGAGTITLEEVLGTGWTTTGCVGWVVSVHEKHPLVITHAPKAIRKMKVL
ncbi:MAG: hypothetical protein ACRETL_17105 [Gammaproteobacteria bacterium]